MNNIHSRINLIINKLGLSKNAFGEIVGISSSQMTNITTNEKDFGVSILLKIVSSYKNINPDWLLFGEGEMFRVGVVGEKVLLSSGNTNINGDIDINGVNINEHQSLVDVVSFLKEELKEKNNQLHKRDEQINKLLDKLK